MSSVPTLYKARRVPTKQTVCAICVERTRGRTTRLDFGYGVAVWLCRDHACPEFLSQRSGRDLAVTLQRLWSAHGCLTRSRSRALRAFLARQVDHPAVRGRPGSYAWPLLRCEAERRFAQGAKPELVHRDLRSALDGAAARPPSLRTVERWWSDRRWLEPAPPSPSPAPAGPPAAAPAPPSQPAGPTAIRPTRGSIAAAARATRPRAAAEVAPKG